jgi:histidine ammonia-lyase
LYNRITPSSAAHTVVLTGRQLTIEQVIDVARYGAKVQLSPEARQRSADAYGLLLEAAAENIPVYWFNRGSGAGRETVIFQGDALAPENKDKLAQRQLAIFRRGASAGVGPEVGDEEIVRAMMVVRANTLTYEAASPPLTQMLLDLLNNRITPVVQSRGSVGEGDLAPLSNVGGAMVGVGEVYYRGARMTAADALRQARLQPLAPFAADDSALTSSNAYGTAQVVLMLWDAGRALDWADLVYAIDLNGMNSSVTPLTPPVQAARPLKWLNWHANRILGLLRGSYLFDDDPHRIIQDPESLRASSIRQASAWQAWGALRDDILVQINSSDHNPAVAVGAEPRQSWALDTPYLRKFFVQGGRLSHGQHGFILSNANWDPYPYANEVEAFTIALANLDVAVAQRLTRFSNSFFTVVRAGEVLPAGQAGAGAGGVAPAAIFQEVQGLMNPVPPEGNAMIQTVEDLQAETRLKAVKARQAVDVTFDLLAQDLLTGALWLDVRKAQDAKRSFGLGPDKAWAAFRQAVPRGAADGAGPAADRAAAFLKSRSATEFHPDGLAPAP